MLVKSIFSWLHVHHHHLDDCVQTLPYVIWTLKLSAVETILIYVYTLADWSTCYLDTKAS